METTPTFTDTRGPSPVLLCPICGDESTHVDGVMIAAGPEDCEQRTTITVKATSGVVKTYSSRPTPTIAADHGRRHRIALIGWCENGGHKFSLVFAQHKGNTFVGATDEGLS